MSEIRYTPPAAASGPTGSGAAGQVTFWSAATVLSGSNNLFWDNTNARLGIGTNAPGYKLHNTGNSYFGSTMYFGGNQDYISPSSNNGIFEISSNLPIVFKNNSGTQFGRFASTGNLLLNTTTDAGSKLYIKGAGSTSSTTSFLINNSSSTKLLQIDDSGNVFIPIRLTLPTNADLYLASTRFAVNNGSIYLGDINGTGVDMNFICKSGSGSLTLGNGTNTTLSVNSTNAGFLPPRMTDTQILAIVTPPAGLMAYSTTQNVLAFYDGTGWRKVNHAAL